MREIKCTIMHWATLKSHKISEMTCGLQVLVKEGKVKHIGLSECSPNDVRKANARHPIAALEMEWSLFSRDAEVCT